MPSVFRLGWFPCVVFYKVVKVVHFIARHNYQNIKCNKNEIASENLVPAGCHTARLTAETLFPHYLDKETGPEQFPKACTLGLFFTGEEQPQLPAYVI